MQGKKIYQEQLFTQIQLSQLVPADNFYRRLREVLDLSWLYKSTAHYYGTEGQASIDPVVFFKLILIGYLENQPSDRRIISMVGMRMDMLFFIGYDLGEPLPWHSTLSRTRQLYGAGEFRRFFCEVLKQCIDKGMVAGRRQAVDSALVKANASMASVVDKDLLESVSAYSDQLDKEEEEGHEPPTGGAKSHRGKKKGRNQKQYSPTDPDAKLSTKPGKPTQLNYLAQVSVDTTHHVITHIEAHTADKRDSECLAAAVSHTVENLRTEGLEVEEILADAGYSSPEALQYLTDNNLTGYIPNSGPYKPQREGFIYDEQRDCYTCAEGKELPYKKTVPTTDGHFNKVYRSSRTDCKTCPARQKCIGEGKYKTLYQTTSKPLYDQMHHRMQTLYARRMRRLRHSTVEPVLGALLQFNGMKKLHTRGLPLATKCMLMAAAAYNLKKLLKFSSPKVQSAVKSMKKGIEGSCNALLNPVKTWMSYLPSFLQTPIIHNQNLIFIYKK